MVKKILVFNVGSSTIKFSLFENREKILEGKYEKLKSKEDYEKSFEKISNELSKKVGFDIIAHRVVHGGNMKSPVKIDKKVKEKIRDFSKFAPLHNSRELMIINLAEKFKKPQFAVFDTSFFIKLPEITKLYPIPKELSKKYHIRKYGFHGLSHESVSRGLKGKTITCHLGRGASMTAIKNNKPIDTSMGLTPLEGLMMCTRSGDLDPGIVLFLEKKGYDTDKILNIKSGIKGITNQKYSDFRDILKNIKNKEAKLAYDMFVYRIIKYIGAYTAVLDGLNNLIFTGAIGENAPRLRRDICEHLDFLGIKLDKNKNEKNKGLISSSSSKVKIYVKSANEDEIIIREVLKIIK
ncbi:MAG: acetate/propionate family kinase [Nanoarchaeota archaeon]